MAKDIRKKVKQLAYQKAGKTITGKSTLSNTSGSEGDIAFRNIRSLGLTMYVKMNRMWHKILSIPSRAKILFDKKAEFKDDVTARSGTIDLSTKSGKGLILPTQEPKNGKSGSTWIDSSASTLNIHTGSTGWYTFFGASTASSSVNLSSESSDKPIIRIESFSTTNDTSGIVQFVHEDGTSEAGVADDVLGRIQFYGNDSVPNAIQSYAQIIGEIQSPTSGSETGRIKLQVAEQTAGGLIDGLVVKGATTNGEVDVDIGAGAGSTTKIVGDLTVSGNDIFFTPAASTIQVNASAHDEPGDTLTISAGDTTAGTTNNIVGGNLILQGGQGKGAEVGGDIVFQLAPTGDSGSVLNALQAKSVEFSIKTDDTQAIVTGIEDGSASVILSADEHNAAGDSWKIQSLANTRLMLASDINSQGTYVSHLTITPNATATDSICNVGGNLTVSGSYAKVTGAGAYLGIKESSANTGLGAHGNIWVKNDTPTNLCFTDDADNDFKSIHLTPFVKQSQFSGDIGLSQTYIPFNSLIDTGTVGQEYGGFIAPFNMTLQKVVVRCSEDLSNNSAEMFIAFWAIDSGDPHTHHRFDDRNWVQTSSVGVADTNTVLDFTGTVGIGQDTATGGSNAITAGQYVDFAMTMTVDPVLSASTEYWFTAFFLADMSSTI